MAIRSAGLAMYRRRGNRIEVLVVHLGGPFWKKKDVWFIPKGEIEPGEDELAAAKREFQEETGLVVGDDSPMIDLGEVTQKGGKTVRAWAFEGDCDPASLRSNTFELEWPPKSGRKQVFPEVDRASFLSLAEARGKVHPAQFILLERLAGALDQEASRGNSGIFT